MPKMKTKRSAAKRLKPNAGGKYIRGRAKVRHNTGKKSSKVLRRLRGSAVLKSANTSSAKATLPYRKKNS